MRKLKPKKEEKKIEEKEEVNKNIDGTPFNKLDYIFYILFFAAALFSKEPFNLVIGMSSILAVCIFLRYFTKFLTTMYVYRILVFFIISILSWPINLLIHKFFI